MDNGIQTPRGVSMSFMKQHFKCWITYFKRQVFLAALSIVVPILIQLLEMSILNEVFAQLPQESSECNELCCKLYFSSLINSKSNSMTIFFLWGLCDFRKYFLRNTHEQLICSIPSMVQTVNLQQEWQQESIACVFHGICEIFQSSDSAEQLSVPSRKADSGMTPNLLLDPKLQLNHL